MEEKMDNEGEKGIRSRSSPSLTVSLHSHTSTYLFCKSILHIYQSILLHNGSKTINRRHQHHYACRTSSYRRLPGH